MELSLVLLASSVFLILQHTALTYQLLSINKLVNLKKKRLIKSFDRYLDFYIIAIGYK